MELLYLICSIVSTSLTSLTRSLGFFIRRLFTSTGAVNSSDSQSVSLYQGTVWHERRRPVHHSFRYSVRYALIDLDHGAPPPDHLSPVQARTIAQTNGPVLLLTIPPSVGYQQNPLSIYYCYNLQDSTTSLEKCIAEVTNTPWGERVSFLFDPNSDLVAKPLHVSPFMDMLGNWNIRTSTPGDSLLVAISVQHPNLDDYFTATLTAKRVSSSAADPALFFWLMPHKVAIWIYWQALKLWWKNVQFIQHPRYHSPAYIEEALLRDKKFQCCPAFATETNSDQLSDEGRNPGLASDRNSEDRWFMWRDAKWPWC